MVSLNQIVHVTIPSKYFIRNYNQVFSNKEQSSLINIYLVKTNLCIVICVHFQKPLNGNSQEA